MTERLTLTEATPVLGHVQQEQASKGRFRALLIKAGWGSSGYYSEEVLKRDGPRCWPAGTQQYLNHPTATESVEQPERAVQDWASEIVTDPVWDPAEGGLVAEVQVFPQWRGLLNQEFTKKVGLSIRAYGLAEHGEADGRAGTIITELTEGISVDWVTNAGAGGKVLELIESARRSVVQEARNRNIGAWFEARIHSGFTVIADEMYGDGRISREERIALSGGIGDGLDAFTKRVTADQPQLYQRDLWAGPDEDDATLSEGRRQVLREAHGMTANDLSQALSDAVREEYGGKQIYTWVRDYADDWAVFSVEDGTDCVLYRQGYTVDAARGAATLTGDAVEVRARTTYTPTSSDDKPADDKPAPEGEPVTENAPGSPPADEKDKEGDMPELTEAEARELTAARDKALAEAATAQSEAAKAQADAAKAVAEKQAADLRLARFQAAEAARPIASQVLAESTLPVPAQVRILGDVTADSVPLTDAGALDESALRTRIGDAIKREETYLASVAEDTGQGKPRGLGEAGGQGGAGSEVDDAETKKSLVEAYKARGMSPAAAELAATGRPF